MSVQTKHFEDVKHEARWDAEFYGPNFAAIRNALLARGAVPLRQFVREANRGIGPAYDPTGSVRVINSVNVRDLEVSDDRESRVTSGDLSANPQASVRTGDLMVTSTGIGTLGRVFCNLSDEVYFADGHVTVLRLRNPEQGPYLSAFLQSSLGRIQFIQRRRGSSRQVEIYPEDILSVLVPTFPDFQKSISKEWCEAVNEVAQARALYPKAEQTILKEFNWPSIDTKVTPNHFVSSVDRCFGENRLDPEFFSPRNICLEQRLIQSRALQFREIADSYVKGVRPGEYSPDGDITVIKSKDVLRIGINMATCERAFAREIEAGQGIVRPAMLVMNMTGVGTLGRTSVVPEFKGTSVVSVDVSGWTIRQDTLPVEYVSLFLNCPIGMAQTIRYQTGSSGQLHLYPEHIRRLLVFVKRDSSGSILREWHDNLACQVREASSARLRGVTRLQRVQSSFTQAVGLDPRFVRE